MKFFRTLLRAIAISVVFVVPSAWSATDVQQDGQHPAGAPTAQGGQAQPGMPASGMGPGRGNSSRAGR